MGEVRSNQTRDEIRCVRRCFGCPSAWLRLAARDHTTNLARLIIRPLRQSPPSNLHPPSPRVLLLSLQNTARHQRTLTIDDSTLSARDSDFCLNRRLGNAPSSPASPPPADHSFATCRVGLRSGKERLFGHDIQSSYLHFPRATSRFIFGFAGPANKKQNIGDSSYQSITP